jgi:hypothetical protein
MMWKFGLNWLSMTLMMLGAALWIVLLVTVVWAMLRWLNLRTVSPSQQTETRQSVPRQRWQPGIAGRNPLCSPPFLL